MKDLKELVRDINFINKNYNNNKYNIKLYKDQNTIHLSREENEGIFKREFRILINYCDEGIVYHKQVEINKASIFGYIPIYQNIKTYSTKMCGEVKNAFLNLQKKINYYETAKHLLLCEYVGIGEIILYKCSVREDLRHNISWLEGYFSKEEVDSMLNGKTIETTYKGIQTRYRLQLAEPYE